MDVLLMFVCTECRKSVIVHDREVEDDVLNCPHCGAEIVVPADDEEDDE